MKLTVEEINQKLDEFFGNKDTEGLVIPFGKYEVALWNWGKHIEDGYLRANDMSVRMSYLCGIILLISVRSGAGWVPNVKDREYILNYLRPLIKGLRVGKPEEIYIKSVGTRTGNANVLNFKWCNGRHKSLLAAITEVFDI